MLTVTELVANFKFQYGNDRHVRLRDFCLALMREERRKKPNGAQTKRMRERINVILDHENYPSTRRL